LLSRFHGLKHFEDANDTVGVFWKFFHLAKPGSEAVGVVVEVCTYFAADVAQPFEAVVLWGRWRLGVHGF